MDSKHDTLSIREKTPFISLVFAIFACAARIVDDPRLRIGDDSCRGMVYYERLVNKSLFFFKNFICNFNNSVIDSALVLHYISHASTQLAHVQCIVLLSSFLCAVNCLPQAWLLVGQAVRMAQDLGLHVSYLFNPTLYISCHVVLIINLLEVYSSRFNHTS